MRLRQIFVTATVFLLITACLGSGQEKRDTTAERDAMKKLEFWIGTWEGTGWYQAGPGGKRETNITEIIQPKLGGLALLAEGLGRAKEVVTHNAMGVICYDADTKQYRFTHFKAGSKPGESELKLVDGGVQWELSAGKGKVRFTAKIDKDRWNEIGEFSPDGKSWIKIMEMNLTRKKS